MEKGQRHHVAFNVMKLALKAAGVAAAVAIASEIHRVHKAIEAREDRKRR